MSWPTDSRSGSLDSVTQHSPAAPVAGLCCVTLLVVVYLACEASKDTVAMFTLTDEAKRVIAVAFFESRKQWADSYVPFDTATRTGAYYALDWDAAVKQTLGMGSQKVEVDSPEAFLYGVLINLEARMFIPWAERVLLTLGTREQLQRYRPFLAAA